MANRGAFSPLLAPGLASIFFKQLKVRKTEYAAWCNVKKSQRAYEEEYKIAGLGQLVVKGEGEVYTFDEPLSGDTIRYTHQTFGLGFRVTEEMLEDDLYGVMNKMSAELAKAAMYNKDVQAATILNFASDSTFSGLDGIELGSTVHPLLGGGTGSNTFADPTDFDMPSLQAALELFENWTDDRGFKTDAKPMKVLHGVPNIWAVGEVLQTEKVPDSNDNAVNIVRSRYGLSDQLLKHLTTTSDWGVISAPGEHDLKMWMRVDTQFRNSDDPLNGDAIFTTRQRLSTGFGDWRNIVFVQGT